MIKCTVSKLETSKALFLISEYNKKIVASTIVTSQYPYTIPSKLGYFLEEGDMVYLDVNEENKLQNIVIPINKLSEGRIPIDTSNINDVSWLNTKIEDLSDSVEKRERLLLKFTETLEKRYKNLTLWTTINTLWIIALMVLILSHI